MSTFRCEVVPIKLEKHPNADSLSIVTVFDGYTVVVRTEEWEGKDMGVYIPPDSVVPDTEQFKFLEGHRRIKVHKFRGIESYGMLVPIPDAAYFEVDHPITIGLDLSEYMNIQHYEPEFSVQINQGLTAYDPPYKGTIYDIEPWQKYKNEFVEGEEVVITEKIHGMNAKFTLQFDGDTTSMYCGSHKHWVKCGDNIFWNILKSHPWVEAFCRLNPNAILYGEIFGAVQEGYNYGSTTNNPYQFRAFDVYVNGKFLDYDDALGNASSDFLVPVLYRGPYSSEIVQKFVSGMSVIPGAKHIREGVVIKPIKERFSPRLHDRLILKYVSFDYLKGKKKND